MADHDQDERPEDEGTFRWPSSGLPRVLGQPSGERAAEPPAPPRISLAPQSPYPEPPWEPGAGLASGPGPDVHPMAGLFGLADEYDAVDDYDSADAYGPPGGWASATEVPAPAGQGEPGAAEQPDESRAATGYDTGQAEHGVPADNDPGDGAADEDDAAGSDPQGGAADEDDAADGEPSGENVAARAAPAGRPDPADEPAADDHAPAFFLAPALSPSSSPGSPSPWVPAAPPLNLQPPDPEPPGETADSLTADLLLPGRYPAPADGWRRLLHRSTGGLIRVPQSAAARHRQQLEFRACTPVAAGHYRVAVLSLKGGVGKTTTVMGLGATLASLRGDRVIAVDANPDRGTLSDKLRLETAATVRDLLNERGQVDRYADVRAYTTQAPSGLEVLASDRDPTVSVAFGEQDYLDVAQVLAQYYSVCITDCGTGLLHSAMAGVLQLADRIILVSSPSVDGARSASATLDWLTAHGYRHLVRSAVVVLSAVRPPGKSTVDLMRLEQHFAARCRAVQRVPYDDHLAEGAEVDLARLGRATAGAYLALAAVIGDGFAGQARPAWQPGAR